MSQGSRLGCEITWSLRVGSHGQKGEPWRARLVLGVLVKCAKHELFLIEPGKELPPTEPGVRPSTSKTSWGTHWGSTPPSPYTPEPDAIANGSASGTSSVACTSGHLRQRR